MYKMTFQELFDSFDGDRLILRVPLVVYEKRFEEGHRLAAGETMAGMDPRLFRSVDFVVTKTGGSYKLKGFLAKTL